MSELADKKPISALEVILLMSKITDDKMIGPNYLDWSKAVHLYFRSIRMAGHLIENPPIDDLKD